ncbi:MAG TPA: IclR family transcriptional regulator [Jatrophihabitans sp.]|nr:IclR family transcriptional regulator [Jatrophihabitans sp.]
MPGAIQSVERAAAILQLVAEYPAELGLTDITETLQLAKPTTHGLLRTLRDLGFVEQLDPGGRYVIGESLAHLGQRRLDANELRSHSVNWCDSLAGRSGLATRVAVQPAGAPGEPVIVHHVFRPDDSSQTLQVGTTVPAHATALGLVLLAGSPALRRHRPRQLERYTGRTVTDPARLATELAAVRRQGWACRSEEYLVGEAGLAAPIRNTGGRVVAALGVAGPSDLLCDTRRRPRPDLLRLVAETARAISRDLAIARR